MRRLLCILALASACSAPMSPVIEYLEPAAVFVENDTLLHICGEGFVPRIERASLSDPKAMEVDAGFLVRVIDEDGRTIVEKDGRWVDETVVELHLPSYTLTAGRYTVELEDPRGNVAHIAMEAHRGMPSGVGAEGMVPVEPLVVDGGTVVADAGDADVGTVDAGAVDDVDGGSAAAREGPSSDAGPPPIQDSPPPPIQDSPPPPSTINAVDVALSDERTFVAWRSADEIFVETYNGDLSLGVQSVAAVDAGSSTPKLTVLSTGRALVAWSDGGSVRARRVRPNGLLVGNEIEVATVEADPQRSVDVAPLGTGFVVSWDGPSVGDRLCARCFDASGSAQGDEQQISFFRIGEHALGSRGDEAVAVYRRTETPPGLWTRVIREDCSLSSFPAAGMVDGTGADIDDTRIVYTAPGDLDNDLFLKRADAQSPTLLDAAPGDQRAASFARGGNLVIFADVDRARAIPFDDAFGLSANVAIDLGAIDPDTVPRAAARGDTLVVARILNQAVVVTRVTP